MAYNVIDVAEYSINYSNDKKYNISNLKLQKLLYYIQAAFLVEKNEPCFLSTIEHWRHGPVVADMYREYKRYSDQNIPYQKGHLGFRIIDESGNEGEYKFYKYNENLILDEDKMLINKVINSYKNTDPWDMVEKTHKENPWKQTASYEEIKRNEIALYFRDNKDRIYGA